MLRASGWHFQFVCRSLITALTPVASRRPAAAPGHAITLSALGPLIALPLDTVPLDILKTERSLPEQFKMIYSYFLTSLLSRGNFINVTIKGM